VTYTAEISRANPACIVFVVDQSGSMQDAIAGEERSKAEVVADTLNRFLSELSLKAAKEEGVRDYFFVSVIGYGEGVGSALGAQFAGQDLLPISRVADNPVRVEERPQLISDGAGGLVERAIKFPVWLDPVAVGGTPMCAALGRVRDLVNEWTDQYKGSFPPIVIHITDGESTDGDPSSVAAAIRGLSTEDGSVLLFNMHVSSDPAGLVSAFPASDLDLPNDYAKLLFSMSSMLPGLMSAAAAQSGIQAVTESRGFAYNADSVRVVQFLDIGTRTPELR
jgi:uncharacterized protein YegL